MRNADAIRQIASRNQTSRVEDSTNSAERSEEHKSYEIRGLEGSELLGNCLDPFQVACLSQTIIRKELCICLLRLTEPRQNDKLECSSQNSSHLH